MAKKPALKPAQYKKHQPPRTWNRETILGTKGKGNPARFKPGLPLTSDEIDMQYNVDATPIPGHENSEGAQTLWKKMPYVVGASNGVETQYILFKVGSGEVHARPVSLNELRGWGVKIT